VRTNIDLDDELVERAMKLTGERTKRGVVHRALRLLVATEGQGAIRRLKGKIKWSATSSEAGRAACARVDAMVIVDTTVWIDYLAGRETPQVAWLETHLTAQRLGLLDLILCEILQGLETDRDAALVLRDLRRFALFKTGGSDLAVEAAHRYRQLRARGRTVRKTIDCLIATFCLRNAHALLHNDRDFDAFEEELGLTVVHPGD